MDGANGLKEKHARSRACRVEHTKCERFYRPGKGYGRRTAKVLRRSARL